MVNRWACYKPHVAELPASVDVAIIGGGFAGCATAWSLRRRGVRAVVIEREPELGRFASGRGAGLGRQLAEDDPTSALTIRGAAMLRGRFAAAWRPTGGILTFDDDTYAQTYIARAERLAVGCEVIDHEAVLARWPALDRIPIACALFVPTDGVIDVRALLALFADEAQVVFDTGVQRVEKAAAGARVTTTRGVVEARVVVDAAGAWAGAATADPPLDIYKRHLFVLEVASPVDGPYLWHLGVNELYVRGEAGVTLASPCDEILEPAGDPTPESSGLHRLRALLEASSKPWAAAPVARAWACQRTFTPDRQMLLGRDPARPWLVWAAGLGGHGATASPAVGEVVADAVVAALT